jgi:iron complex outermembrane receptor protein
MSVYLPGAASARALLGALALSPVFLSAPVWAADDDADRPPTVAQVEVRASRSVVDGGQLPVRTEGISAAEITRTVNALNTEDALKYLPDVLVRKRHPGDVQAPITTRTSGLGSSARSLVYADGVLLSALIGNNNSFASPRWGMVAPEEIARIDVLYGPFAAQFPGNSVGAVVEITTRLPEHLEATAGVDAADQRFSQYGTQGDFTAWRAGATIGDRRGPFAWWLSASRLDADSQPLSYVTVLRPATPSAAGTAVTGAFADTNRTNAPIFVLGAGGFEHQVQDTLKLKLAWDLTPDVRAVWTGGYFGHADDAHAQSYLKNAMGDAAYDGALNIGGYAVSVPASAFSSTVYRLDEHHWMQSLTLGSHTGGVFDWEAIATAYDYATDRQRAPTGALPGAVTGGAGTVSVMDGTGWSTLDLKAIWRPGGPHSVSFGAHHDQFEFNNPKYLTADWIDGGPGALASLAQGRTRTDALWAQDVWRLAPELNLTLGARWEHWRAWDGFNFSASPALSVAQPSLSRDAVSPKASLAWTPIERWRLTASFGTAYRFPTVTELYQAISTGPTLTSPNPNLRPERAHSWELSAERREGNGRVRISLFEEDLKDALISQTAPLAPGSSTLFSFVQNIDRVRSRGVELVAEQRDVLVPGLELSGYVTWVDSRILADAAFAAAVGKQTPQLPRWRGAVVASYRPDDRLSLSLAARYSDPAFATLDNSDTHATTWQGFDGYFVVDARAHYRISDHWSGAVGADNLFSRKYFLFHPFPQRTVQAELKYAW